MYELSPQSPINSGVDLYYSISIDYQIIIIVLFKFYIQVPTFFLILKQSEIILFFLVINFSPS